MKSVMHAGLNMGCRLRGNDTHPVIPAKAGTQVLLALRPVVVAFCLAATAWLAPSKAAASQQATAAPDGATLKAKNKLVSADAREQYLARAQIHVDSDVSGKNVFNGPQGKGTFEFRQQVDCTYEADAELGGNSPKFQCVDADNEKLKVKYGCANGEVFGEVAATRLLWLLGFEADRMYPVVVKCKNCPPTLLSTEEEKLTGRFDCAIIERKTGDEIESFEDQGWGWEELSKVAEAAGGAPRAHVDALKLIAVILQHNDNKASNQRMVCPKDNPPWDSPGDKPCIHPQLVVQDVGAAFGGAGNRVRPDSKMDVVHWREQMIWRDGRSCVANLHSSTKNGTLFDPQISEEGRAFLSELLQKVSAEQVHDLFRVAQVTLRDSKTNLAEWESAFWYKAYQIVNHRCADK